MTARMICSKTAQRMRQGTSRGYRCAMRHSIELRVWRDLSQGKDSKKGKKRRTGKLTDEWPWKPERGLVEHLQDGRGDLLWGGGMAEARGSDSGRERDRVWVWREMREAGDVKRGRSPMNENT